MGATLLRFNQPSGFGPVLAGRGQTRSRVAPRTMTFACGRDGIVTSGRDPNLSCGIGGAPAGTVVEAVPSDPNRLLLANDPRVPAGIERHRDGTDCARLQRVASPCCAAAHGSALRDSSITSSRGGTQNVSLFLFVSGPDRAAARAGSVIRVGVGATPGAPFPLNGFGHVRRGRRNRDDCGAWSRPRRRAIAIVVP